MNIRSWWYRFLSERHPLLTFRKRERKSKVESIFCEHFCWCNLIPNREIRSINWLFNCTRIIKKVTLATASGTVNLLHICLDVPFWCKKVVTPRGTFQATRYCKLNLPSVCHSEHTKHQKHPLLETIGKTPVTRVREKRNGTGFERQLISGCRVCQKGFQMRTFV